MGREKKNAEGAPANGGGSSGSSRWVPANEQILILEEVFKRGLRTPNYDQIQKITSRLKAYGHIEGKNVFYWFQNHKSRLKQKQKKKQENMAYINRCLHTTGTTKPVSLNPPRLAPNVVCCPYTKPKYSNVVIPSNFKRKAVMTEHNKVEKIRGHGDRYETLNLFPLHPTGILEGRSVESVGSTSTTSSSDGIGNNSPLIDFFLFLRLL